MTFDQFKGKIPENAKELLQEIIDQVSKLARVLGRSHDLEGIGASFRIHALITAEERMIDDLFDLLNLFPFRWFGIDPNKYGFRVVRDGERVTGIFYPHPIRRHPTTGAIIPEQATWGGDTPFPEGSITFQLLPEIGMVLYWYENDEQCPIRNFLAFIEENLKSAVRIIDAMTRRGYSLAEASTKVPGAETSQYIDTIQVPSLHGNLLLCQGDTWRMCYQGQEFTAKDSDGMQYLAMLLSRPGKSIWADRMYGQLKDGGGAPLDALIGEPDRRKVSANAPPTMAIVEIAGDKLMDKAAIADAKRRLIELKELQLADNFQDPSSMVECKSEIAKLERQIKQATRPSGTLKRQRTNADRRADNIRKATQATIRNIREHHSALAQHLTESIKYGSAPIYSADKRWDVIRKPVE